MSAALQEHGWCYSIVAQESVPGHSLVNMLYGMTLFVTFLYTLKEINRQTRLALAGRKTEGVLTYSVHVTIFHLTTLWAVLWAVFKTFNTDTETVKNWHVYHALATGLVNGFALLLEVGVYLQLLSASMSLDALRKSVLRGLAVALLYAVSGVVVLWKWPGEIQALPSQEGVTFYMVSSLLLCLFFASSLVRNCLDPAGRQRYQVYGRFARFEMIYNLALTLGWMLQLLDVDFGMCIDVMARTCFFLLFARVLFFTLAADSAYWQDVVSGGGGGGGGGGSGGASSLRSRSESTTTDLDALEQHDYSAFSSDLEVQMPSQYDDCVIPANQLVKGRVLGSGGDGVAILYYHHGDEVVVKRLLPRICTAESIRDFSREAGLLRHLRHPYVVEFVGVYFDPPYLGIVTKFCAKESLHKVLEATRQVKCGRERVDNAELALDPLQKHPLQIAYEIAQGMLFLHEEQGIAHRDLKSLNVLIDDTFTAKLTDFGDYARTVSGKPRRTPGTKRRNSYHGTPAWMSPEALLAQELGRATDVFSFGVVLWELLTFQEPFVVPTQGGRASFHISSRGSTDSEQLEDTLLRPANPAKVLGVPPNAHYIQGLDDGRRYIVDDQLRPPIPPGTPDMLKALLNMCWEQDPKDRPDFQVICDALKDCVDGQVLPAERLPLSFW